jgi:hypothetical protein
VNDGNRRKVADEVRLRFHYCFDQSFTDSGVKGFFKVWRDVKNIKLESKRYRTCYKSELLALTNALTFSVTTVSLRFC